MVLLDVIVARTSNERRNTSVDARRCPASGTAP